jgi:hypothetical protein
MANGRLGKEADGSGNSLAGLWQHAKGNSHTVFWISIGWAKSINRMEID